MVVQAILRKIYVDDYLGSAASVEEGVKEAIAVAETLASADLHLQGWISNSPDLIQKILEGRVVSTTQKAPQHSLTSNEGEKVLGVFWNTTSDTLGFPVKGLEDIQYTRVGLISKVASVFDPLGTASPLIVKAKIRLRELGIKGLDWTDSVDEEDKIWWQSWFQMLSKLTEVALDRCLFQNVESIAESQIHTFCDASEEAYGALVYLRNTYGDACVKIVQIKGSTKIAPKKCLSVPKLELNAALLGSRLALFVSSCLSHRISRRYFWTDSSTVRNWIRATVSFYQVFVANRVGEIQTLTQTEEWRFIPMRLYPADGATRSNIEEDVLPELWLNGPGFLLRPSRDWPEDLPWLAVAEEIRKCKVKLTRVDEPPDWSKLMIDQSNISSVLKLEGEFLEVVKACQFEAFGDELRRLGKGKGLHHTSHLLPLSPILGKDGIIRLGGRIGRAKLPYDVVHPPLLPNKH
ncbi:uncharacterized protein LOC130697275 [Daphnia carinata]|uniref:uncharacterized protein LOC130697275 n=1 Tax=Daphnia carinata TaxID=120202 RepID=UPI00257A72B6|nr:uncharacterized protein LOC130697275 [Daphnia carinata]